MKAIVTIKPLDADSATYFKEWLAEMHGDDVPLANALRDEIKSWMEFDSNAEVSVDVEIVENQ